MKEIIFKGNYRKIGQQLGKIYAENRVPFDDTVINKTLLKRQIAYYKKFYPKILEEFLGMAESGGHNHDKVVYDNIVGEIIWYKNKLKKSSCTIFGVKNDAGTFIGRNYDWYPGSPATIYRYENVNCYSYLAITDEGYFPGATERDIIYYPDDAINEKGLYIGITFAHGAHTAYGLSSSHLRRLILERCKNVAEALAIFKKIPICCPKNFFLADKDGNMAVVEHASSYNYKILKPVGGVLIKTNHYLDSELAKQDLILKARPTNSTYVRYYELLRNINIIGIDRIRQNKVSRLILDNDSYIRQNSAQTKTIWSLSLDMKKQKYDFYHDGVRKRLKI